MQCTDRRVQSFKNGGTTIPVGLGVEEYHPRDESPVVFPGFFAKIKRTRCIQKLNYSDACGMELLNQNYHIINASFILA